MDLVILDERATCGSITNGTQTGIAGDLGKPGGVFLTSDKLPTDDAVLLAAAARRNWR
jgi:hypothetical protein